MSSQARTAPPPANPHRPPPGRGPGAWMSAGMPAEKSMDFWPSARRMLGRLGPERMLVMAVLALSVAGVAFAVVGPKILGNATNINVNSYRGVVQLNGFVESQDKIQRAADVTRGVEGVRSVENNLRVKPSS